MRKLTLKEKRLVDHYVICGEKKEAAIRAGYSRGGAHVLGCRTLQKPPVQEYLQEKLNKVNQKMDISKEWRLGKLKQIADSFVSQEKQILDSKEAKVAVSAIAEINKMEGDYAPTKIISANLNIEADAEMIDELMPLYDREF